MSDTKPKYESPRLDVIGRLDELTKSLDKIGSRPDFLTQYAPDVDGSIVPDRP